MRKEKPCTTVAAYLSDDQSPPLRLQRFLPATSSPERIGGWHCLQHRMTRCCFCRWIRHAVFRDGAAFDSAFYS
jgi:hypothetical protein